VKVSEFLAFERRHSAAARHTSLTGKFRHKRSFGGNGHVARTPSSGEADSTSRTRSPHVPQTPWSGGIKTEYLRR
jgi:hypothetical protein